MIICGMAFCFPLLTFCLAWWKRCSRTMMITYAKLLESRLERQFVELYIERYTKYSNFYSFHPIFIKLMNPVSCFDWLF